MSRFSSLSHSTCSSHLIQQFLPFPQPHTRSPFLSSLTFSSCHSVPQHFIFSFFFFFFFVFFFFVFFFFVVVVHFFSLLSFLLFSFFSSSSHSSKLSSSDFFRRISIFRWNLA